MLAPALVKEGTEEVLRVQGNEQVCKLLKFWYTEAEKGRLNGVSVVATDGSTTGIDYTGASGFSEYMLYFGTAEIMRRIAEQVWNRQAPQGKTAIDDKIAGRDLKLNISKQVYNAANLTPGYDFLAWILAAEMRRIKHHGPPPLRIAINLPPDGYGGGDFVHNYNLLMVNNVMKPIIKMIGGVYTDKIEDDFVWPPLGCFQEVVDFYKEGVPLPALVPHEDAVLHMEKYKGAVTITLREATHWPQRNSDIAVWTKAARALQKLGERVIFIRDTEKAHEPLDKFEICPEAAVNINCRAAVYAAAKCNLFVSNGPGTVDWFCGNTPSLMYIPLSSTDGYKCSRPEWWLPNHGIRAGDQFPWFGPQKKIVWQWPDADMIVRDYKELMGAVPKGK